MGEAKKVHVRAVPWSTPTEEKVKGALGELPAYVKRALGLERAVADLYRQAAEVREEMLEIVCLRLRQVLDVLEESEARELPEETVRALGAVLREVEGIEAFYRLAARTRAPRKKGEVARALEALDASIERFNRRFSAWIEKEAPLDAVNELVDGYNRHYAFERQCALRYVPLDQVPFEKRAPLAKADLLERLPLLPHV